MLPGDMPRELASAPLANGGAGSEWQLIHFIVWVIEWKEDAYEGNVGSPKRYKDTTKLGKRKKGRGNRKG